jgi:predicted DNA-binding transcriptional regulator AlpA
LHEADAVRPVQAISLPVSPSPNPARELVKSLAAIPAIALTVAEVCTLFNISRSTLYRANLPGKVVIGGSVRYDKNQLLAWWFDQQKTR